MKTSDTIPGLDGVRAIAIIAVIAFHAEIPGLAPGGFLGVDVFFTLSGFLITSLLLRELSITGKIALRAFYGRRLRRLMPAMLAVVAASSLAAALWAPEAIPRQRQDIPAALLYVSNWWQIYSGQSYFEMFGRPPLLQHLWSLAIEEQFYLAWPLVLLGVGRLAGRRGILLLALALALLSTGAMALLASAQGIPSQASANRLYLGADTHAMGLLIGACLACLWRPLGPHACMRKPGGAAEAATRQAGAAHPWGMELAGLVGIAGVMAAFALASEAHEWLYRGGFALVALLACLVMMGASQQRTLLGAILGHPALRLIGQRSYGLYLWHWPVFVLLRPGQELPASAWLALGLRLLVTVVLTELSFRLIENPVRRHPLSTWQRKGWASLVAACCAGALVLAQLYQARADVAAQLSGAPARPLWAMGALGESAGAGTARPVAAGAAGLAGDQALPPGRFILTAIGDSVMLGSQGQLARTLWPILVDAQSGRQGSEGVKRVRELRHASALADTVLVHLGTNGYLHESNLNDILQELADRKRVIFMTVHASRRWIDENNALLARVVARYANASLINWQAVASEHPEYLAADGVHLNVRGMQAYAGLISQAVGYRSETGGAPVIDASGSVLSLVAAPAPKARPATAGASASGRNPGAAVPERAQAPLAHPVAAPERPERDGADSAPSARLELPGAPSPEAQTPGSAADLKLKAQQLPGSLPGVGG